MSFPDSSPTPPPYYVTLFQKKIKASALIVDVWRERASTTSGYFNTDNELQVCSFGQLVVSVFSRYTLKKQRFLDIFPALFFCVVHPQWLSPVRSQTILDKWKLWPAKWKNSPPWGFWVSEPFIMTILPIVDEIFYSNRPNLQPFKEARIAKKYSVCNGSHRDTLLRTCCEQNHSFPMV